jgi:hypothetical protein
MIRRDFEDGGFPINKRNPVLLFTADGKIFVAYDRFALKAVIDSKVVKKCLGVWPGKYSTDCFVMIPDYYKKAPPEEFRSVDNAQSILVFYGKSKEFKELAYTTENSDGKKIEIRSSNPRLLSYITDVGLQFTSVFD